MSMRLSLLALALASTAAPVLADEINVYSHRQPELIQPLVDAFTAETGEAGAMADLRGRWPNADFVEAPLRLHDWVRGAFGQAGAAQPTPLYLIGAPFQIKVWEALLRIPSGQVTTYSDLATAVGHPRAVRAVGTAVGRNPVSWLIPCHRALRKSGGLGGYHWGLPVKRAMLAWEAARSDAA